MGTLDGLRKRDVIGSRYIGGLFMGAKICCFCVDFEFEKGRVCRLTGISNVRLSVIYDTVELFWT